MAKLENFREKIDRITAIVADSPGSSVAGFAAKILGDYRAGMEENRKAHSELVQTEIERDGAKNSTS